MSLRNVIFLFFWLVSSKLLAQSAPPLDRLISVDIRNEKIESALRQISRVGRFEFSYNPAQIETNAVVTIKATNTPVREVLNRVFQLRVTYKIRGNYVILLRATPPDTSPKSFLLDGYVLDEQTGERVAKASIFEKTTLASTVSNPFGYYRLSLPTNLSAVRLDIRKQAYVGETVIVRSRVSHSINIHITPLPTTASTTSLVQPIPPRITEDTLRSLEASLASVPVEMPAPVVDSTKQQSQVDVNKALNSITRYVTSAQQAIHDINMSRDTLYRDWQVSFVPFMGTNGRLSGRISNRYSINALAGYSFGVRAFELGGLLNVVRENVTGFQASGLANVVGGETKGFQVGGLVNLVGRQFDGFQAGGLANVVNDSVSGIQVGGLMNVVTGQATGFQVGGLTNVVRRSFKGLQVAGLVNYTHGDVQGWQIAGIVNYARRVRLGGQIGLINVADTVGALPIGLLSFIRKGGYQRIEVAANEVNVLNVTLRMGVRRFYNILSAGHSFDRIGSPRLSAGYGVGSAFRLSNGLLFNLEGLYHHLFYFDGYDFDSGWTSQLRLNTLLEAKLGSHVSLAFGPSFNWYFGTYERSRPLLQPDVSLFTDRIFANSNALHSSWFGFQVGLRYGKW